MKKNQGETEHKIQNQEIIKQLQLQLNNYDQLLDKKDANLELLREKLTALSEKLATSNTEKEFLQQKLEKQKEEFEQLQKQAAIEFENIANKLLKKNSEEFTESNQKKISDILFPLKEKISAFEKKVEDTYEKNLKDQSDPKTELKKQHENNQRISDEANNLTNALKADVKQQGNWGEVVLERIMERSGLTKDREYRREVVSNNREGKTIRPDVIVDLPDQKHIIIDSKVSLIAYEKFINAENQDEKAKYIKEHLLSLKTHVKNLNEKHYTSAKDLNSPDFVLLFVPIESSFSVAVEEDKQLFNYAWDNQVVIVSPSTLLATLRTIASIWQQENQTRNAVEIARQSGAMYDKFVGFVTDMETIGKNLNTTQKTYESAINKLHIGKGNLVRRAEQIKELGAKTAKEVPEKFTDKGIEE